MLKSNLVVDLVVVNNHDDNSRFGEAPDANGDTPTGRAVKEAFEGESRFRVVYVNEWGSNAGSGRAVQTGIDYLTEHSTTDTFMVW